MKPATKQITSEACFDELNRVVDRHNAMAVDFLRCLLWLTSQLAINRCKAMQFDALVDENNRLLELAQQAQMLQDEKIIIESDDDAPQYPHHQLVAEIWEQPPKQILSKYILFLGVLWQLGLQADVQVVYETRCVVAESPWQLAQQLGPSQATPTELDEFTRRLHPLLQYKAERWHYRFTHPIEIVTWQRTGGTIDAS